MDQDGLVERARRGDRIAFAELVRASGARLDATARLILRDPDLAQDAVQETLIRAWRGMPGLRDPAVFDHWLHSLVAHACIDIARKRRRRVIEVELDPLFEPSLADGTAQVVDRDLLDRGEGFHLEWSPDGRSLVALPSEGAAHPVIIDVTTGAWQVLDVIAQSAPQTQAWQRLAP